MTKRIDQGVNRQLDALKPDLIKLSNFIYANPELGHQEHKACAAHADLLRKNGFTVTQNYLGLATSFRAEYDSGRPGPIVAYLAEYDALPEIGHGCGHNMLGTTSTGAGIILSRLMAQCGGKAIVIGTPAEETDGAKAHLVAQGAFTGVDVALIAHPSQDHRKSGASQAMESLEFTFHGKTAHAAASPEEGINALDGVLTLFSGINALREHTRTDARIHGIITEGGKAPNIVPDLAKAHFYVRAGDTKYLTELVERVKNCARGASLAAGTTLEMRNNETSYANLITNQALSQTYVKHLTAMGVTEIKEPKPLGGSTDMGDVSHVCPAIHPNFSISPAKLVGHTVEFAKATTTDYAHDQMMKVVGALALTGLEVIKDPELLSRIRREFEAAEK